MSGLIWALIGTGLLASGATAQHQDQKEENKRHDQAVNDTVRYEAIVDAYLAGDEAHSVVLLANPEWDQMRLRALLHRMDYAGGGALWPARRWGAAALLHIDAALRLDASLQSNRAQWQMEVTSGLLRLGIRERGDAVRILAERIYVVLAGLLRDDSMPYSAGQILKAARRQLPDSAPVLEASGILAELLGTDYALARATIYNSPSRGRTFNLGQVVADRAGNLNDAANWLRQATQLDPGSDLLRVHLGRVLALRMDDDEADRVLNGVLQTTKDDATAYLAAVFIGGMRERQVRLDDAAIAYRAAIARFPLGYAAYIGLSEVLQRTRKGDESRDVLRNLLAESLGPTREPLWWYQFDSPGVAEAKLDALREAVRR